MIQLLLQMFFLLLICLGVTCIVLAAEKFNND